ncbi:hypothetical protein V2J09_003216 [Rumex salicifolius]
MEAMLLNCATGLNLGLLLNSIWTWVAVMTAALGFWRIRSLKPDLIPDPDPAEKVCQQPNLPVQANPVRPIQDPTAIEMDRTASTSRLPDERVTTTMTKGNKFKAYYYCMHEEAVVGERENGGDTVAVVEEWRSESAAAAALVAGRREEMGWYRYQDRRVLDGSVVRLWDCSTNIKYRGGHALHSRF